jgi:hypothetical protein
MKRSNDHNRRQKANSAQLQATLNAIPTHAWYASSSGGLTFVNERTADYLGLPKDHPLRFGIDIGAQWDSHIPFLHPDDHEETRKTWSTCLRTGEAGEVSLTLREATAGSSVTPNRSGVAMALSCNGSGCIWKLKSSSAQSKRCGRAS